MNKMHGARQSDSTHNPTRGQTEQNVNPPHKSVEQYSLSVSPEVSTCSKVQPSSFITKRFNRLPITQRWFASAV